MLEASVVRVEGPRSIDEIGSVLDWFGVGLVRYWIGWGLQ